MPDQPAASPALSDADLRETLDLLSTVVASVSDRMDSQTQAIDRLTRTAAETRQAAFAARSQTDPELFAEHAGARIGESVMKPLDLLMRLAQSVSDQNGQALVLSNEHKATRDALLQSIRKEKLDAERWKKRIPFMAIFGLVLALGLALALPRFMAGNAATCAVIGGQMLTPASGDRACVFSLR